MPMRRWSHGMRPSSSRSLLRRGAYVPRAAVPRTARDLTRRHGANLTQADIRHHAVEATAGDQASGRVAQVFVHDVDVALSELRETVAHRVAGSPDEVWRPFVTRAEQYRRCF